MSLTVLKTCCVGEASIAFPSRILILSSRTLRVRASIVANYVRGASPAMEVESRGAGSRVETITRTACAEYMYGASCKTGGPASIG